jgi:hypothetical protein
VTVSPAAPTITELPASLAIDGYAIDADGTYSIPFLVQDSDSETANLEITATLIKIANVPGKVAVKVVHLGGSEYHAVLSNIDPEGKADFNVHVVITVKDNHDQETSLSSHLVFEVGKSPSGTGTYSDPFHDPSATAQALRSCKQCVPGRRQWRV